MQPAERGVHGPPSCRWSGISPSPHFGRGSAPLSLPPRRGGRRLPPPASLPLCSPRTPPPSPLRTPSLSSCLPLPRANGSAENFFSGLCCHSHPFACSGPLALPFPLGPGERPAALTAQQLCPRCPSPAPSVSFSASPHFYIICCKNHPFLPALIPSLHPTAAYGAACLSLRPVVPSCSLSNPSPPSGSGPTSPPNLLWSRSQRPPWNSSAVRAGPI